MSDDRRFTISSSARLSPDDVQRRTFSTVRRGFDTNEVRAFLEVAARELAALTERETELRQALSDAEHRAANPVIDEETLTAALGQETARVLRAARDAAGEVLSRGEQDAARLRTEAQEQADELRSRAERHAAEQTAQSDADAAETRRRAHEDADMMRTKAKLEADSLLADTRTECRAMVHEAQELRSRVLNDLSKRRRVLHSQIEQLRAGRERMAQTIANVRQVVDEVADALLHAEDDARLAAEEASRHLPAMDDELPMSGIDEPVLFADDALAPPAPGNPVTPVGGSDGSGGGGEAAVASGGGGEAAVASGGGGEAAVASGGSLADPEYPGLAAPVVDEMSRGPGLQVVDLVDPAIAEPSGHGRLASLTSADAEAGPGAAEPGTDLDGAGSGDAVIAGSGAGAGGGDAVEVADREAASGGAAGEAASTEELAQSPLSNAMPAGEVGAWEPQGVARPAAAAGSDVDELFARLRASRQTAAGAASDAGPERMGTGAGGGSASTPDRSRRRGAADPASDRRAGDVPSSAAGGPAVPGGSADVYDDDGPAVRLLQAGAKPRARRRPTATQSTEVGAATATSDSMPVVGDLQRSGGSRQDGSPTKGGTRTVPVQSGATGTAGAAEPVEAAVIADPMVAAEPAVVAEPVAPNAVAPGEPEQQSEDTEDDLGPASTPEAGDGPLLARRDDAVRPVIANLARRLKRALQDDQNDLLDRLRSAPGKVGSPSEPVGLPDEEEHRKRYVDVVRSHLAEAARIGAAFVGATAGAQDFDSLGAAEAAELAAALVVPLRRKLGNDADGAGDGDGSHRADQVGAAFREWKGSRVEALAADHVVAAFAAAALDAVPASQKMRWVVDDEGGACADCDDNALAGGVVAGDEFPTGHRHPPVHAGCRCLLAPVSP